MINLLPTSTKTDTMYARRNSVLLKWIVGLTIALVVLVFIIIIGLFYLSQTTKSFEDNTENGRAFLQSQDISGTQKQVEEISSNVKLATDVLSQEVLFSKLIRQIGAALPVNSALQQLQINDISGGITLIALTTDFNSASQIQINLQDENNKVFEKADIENIECGNEPNLEQYFCSVQIKALFSKDSPFLYIQQGGS